MPLGSDSLRRPVTTTVDRDALIVICLQRLKYDLAGRAAVTQTTHGKSVDR